MDFDLTEEQLMYRNTAKDFAQREIVPVAREDDRNEYYRAETIQKMGSLGLLAAPIPEEYGGAGVDHISYVLICEEIASASASIFTTALTVHTSLFQLALLQVMSEEQKRKYFPRITKGELLGCFALTEPNVGSDAASIEATAVLQGDHWVLNGNKMWISNGGIADLALVFAQTDKSKGHRGIAAFLVERGMPGFSSRDIHGKMGLRSSNTAELILDDCQVPAENLIGQVGDGFKTAMYGLDCGRMSTAAACVGVSQAAVEASIKYAQERKQFGRAIGSFQLVQEMIADMIIETEAARFLVLRVGHLKNKAESYTKEAAMAKYYASEVSLRVTKLAIQVHGGYGYSDEYPVERYLRDAMGMALYEGTSQVQKLIVSRDALGIRAFV